MLLFQREYSEALLRLDAFKSDFLCLDLFYKAYDIQAQQEIKRQFQTKCQIAHSALSQK